MLRILHTGDLHLGREYRKQEQENPAVAARYRDARLEALGSVIRTAEENKCDYVVIAGDVFDSRSVGMQLIREVCGMLAGCACPVIVLPGNHDYCEGDADEFWKKFTEHAADNTILLTRNERLVMDDAVFYPCVCNDRYSESNKLGWLAADTGRDSDRPNIGIAHGAIEGLSYDREKKYYFMTMAELESCGMDLWLVGHTHMPYPDSETVSGQRIFNAGTHQQTDIADNSEGSVFLTEIDDDRNVTARRIHTGVIAFVQKNVNVEHGMSLREVLHQAAAGCDAPATTMRIQLSGVALADEYQTRFEIYDEIASDFLRLEIFDEDLRQEITTGMIDEETVEGSVENRLLKLYTGDPVLLELAFGLVKECKEDQQSENR